MMIAYYKRENISRGETPKYDYRIILQNGNTDICLSKKAGLELLSFLTGALKSLEIDEYREINQEI